MLEQILQLYGIDAAACRIEQFGSGLINRTWKISGERSYILQKINTDVFVRPQAITQNLILLGSYLKEKYPDYTFVTPLPALDGLLLQNIDNAAYRLFPFIEGSVTLNEVYTEKQAYEAARQFGQFTYLLRDFDASKLNYTLPQFHDLILRYRQFEKSLGNATAERLGLAADSLARLRSHQQILDRYRHLVGYNLLPLRVIHHDTKISNVLFDEEWNGRCVIDLDTVMPGYFISDVGDMLRTYLSPAGEEETDLSKIKIDTDRFYAIYNGYMSVMADELTAYERENFFYSGKFMTYMQALRFMTDYLNGDIYYHTRYDGQNLNRSKNQLTLLDELLMLEKDIQPSIQK